MGWSDGGVGGRNTDRERKRGSERLTWILRHSHIEPKGHSAVKPFKIKMIQSVKSVWLCSGEVTRGQTAKDRHQATSVYVVVCTCVR